MVKKFKFFEEFLFGSSCSGNVEMKHLASLKETELSLFKF